MNISYHPLLKLGIRHAYFPEEDGSVVRIIPTRSTAAAMKQFSLRMVDRGSGTQELFYGTYPPRTSPLLDLEDPLSLSFILRVEDAFFQNYTELPLEESTQHLAYFTNLAQNSGQVGEGKLLDGGTRLPLAPAIITREIEEGSTITLLDEFGETIANYPLPDPLSENDLSPDIFSLKTRFQKEEDGPFFLRLEINLTVLPTARYALSVDGQEEDPFIPSHDGLQRGDVGIVTVHLGNLGDHGQYVLQGDNILPETYLMSFAARKTIWRYHFIDRNDSGYSGWRILNETSPADDFPDGSEPPEQKQLPGGDTAQVIASTKALPLQRVPDRKLQLSVTQEQGGQEHQITIPLPVADGNRISNQGLTSDHQPTVPPYFSDIFVYL
ncbi:hypothetical protein [Lewinella sp. W8]|uniref:hypothetical protein n=1 Tax=Lewinella sp. W8 TaxID=2528208 RepID=UPI001068C019|nr:hypothetical protein [Lewinella sp. W8]MTB52939.1 hypothetical protein [Lewinella sp. W8]